MPSQPMRGSRRQSEPPEANRIRPRFGWGGEGHRAIEQAGINLLKPSSYRTFLIDNLPAIHQASLLQDQRNSGPDHFVNLETCRDWGQASTPPASPHQGAKPERPFSTIDTLFRADEERLRKHLLTEKPLEASEFEPSRNVFSACLKEYRHLVMLLRDLKSNAPDQPGSKAAISKSLVRCVGSLAHYVGDLNQPQHTSQYYNWQLAYAQKNKAHSHLERQVMGCEQYTNWWKTLKARKPLLPEPPLQEEGVISRLLQSLKRSHFELFRLVDGDRQARKQNDAATYFMTLNQAWQPLMERRLDAATTDLTALLESAYAEAGSPEIPQPMRARALSNSESPFLEASLGLNDLDPSQPMECPDLLPLL